MNVSELLDSKSISFIPKGHDFLINCLNPEHPDNNPSMRVDQITGVYNCFSCEYKGNLFTHFGEKANQLQIKRENLKKLISEKRAESIGLSLPNDAVPYTGDWRNISPETYEHFEAFTSLQSDHSGRLVFPIRDMSGRIVCFQGRHMGQETPKYKITPHKAKIPLFPSVVPFSGIIMIVEGLYDVLNLHDKGITNSMCAFGINGVTEKKLGLLRIKGIDSIDIFFDGDDAGQRGAKDLKELADNLGFHVRNIHLKNTDPGALSEAQVLGLKKKLYEV